MQARREWGGRYGRVAFAAAFFACTKPQPDAASATQSARAAAAAGATSDAGANADDATKSAAAAKASLLAQAPIVLTGAHSPLGSFWLANGHLAIPTESELLEIDPADPGNTWKVRPALAKEPPYAFAGSGGGDRFLVLDKAGVTLWDASSMTAIKQIAKLSDVSHSIDRFGGVPMAMSADGTRGAVILDSAAGSDAGTTLIFDAQTGATITSLIPGEKDLSAPDQVSLSEDGKVAALKSIDECAVDDVSSGKRIVTRRLPRTSSRSEGASIDVCAVRGNRIWLSSWNGLEIVDPTNGHTVARTRDARMVDASMVSLREDGGALLTIGFAWDGKSVTRIAHGPSVSEDSMWREQPRVTHRTDGHFSTFADGSGLAVKDASGQVVLRFGQARGTGYSDEREIEVFGGVVRMHPPADYARKDDVAFSQRTVPAPVQPKLSENTQSEHSQTNWFALVPGKKTKNLALVIWDPFGKEVGRIDVPAASLQMVDGAIALLSTPDALLRCDLSSCAPVAKKYSPIRAFSDPWVVVRGSRERGALVQLQTGEERPLPTECAFEPQVVGPRPDLLCATKTGWLRADGKTMKPFPVPPSREGDDGPSGYAATLDGRLYFNPQRDSFGFDRAYRYDPARDAGAQMYVSDGAALVQFDDGTIERFGDAEQTARMVRCPTEAGWAPYATCAAAWDQRGRFEDPAR